jgi:hypothetical protein
METRWSPREVLDVAAVADRNAAADRRARRGAFVGQIAQPHWSLLQRDPGVAGGGPASYA